MINTIKPDFFPDNIKASLQRRKELKAVENKKYIDMTSDIFNLLSTAVSLNVSSKGRATNLLCVGTKKRKRPT